MWSASMTKAKHDRLLVALLTKLPTAMAPWPRADRIAWLQMTAMAFDVIYGPCGGVRVIAGEACDGKIDQTAPTQHSRIEAAPPSAPRRFYVDRDGFAMGDGKPISMEELPAGAIVWDERAGAECGDVTAILWRDVGTSRRSLPPDIILRPVFEAS